MRNIRKQIVPMLLFVAAFTSLMGFASAQTPDGALSLANLEVSPQPIIAGETMTLTFQLYNSYGQSLQNVDLSLQGSYPLLNFSPSGTNLISTIGTGTYGGTTYFIYHIKIPKNVQAGTYTLDVVATYESTVGLESDVPGTSTMPISIYVSGVPNVDLNANPTNAIVPGQSVGVQINALNTGTGQASNVTMKVENSKNFTVVGTSSFYLGTIAAGAAAAQSVTLQANSSFVPKNSTIPVVLAYTVANGSTVTSNVTLPVSVLVNKPNIVASIAGAYPQTLYSGSNQTLTILLQNVGTGAAKNVTLSFPPNQYITVSSSAAQDFVGTLLPNTAATENVLIIANKNDNKTSYNLPLEISYTNANYEDPTNKTVSLGLNLQSSAQFNITVVSDSLKAGQTYVPVNVTIKNIGNEPAQHVTFSLQTIYPISPVNTNAYVNLLQPGQSTTVTFYVNVDSQGNPGQYPITVYEQWTQPNGATNQQYSGSNNEAAVVYSSSGLGNNTLYIVIAVVVIVAAVILYRRRKATATRSKKSLPKQTA